MSPPDFLPVSTLRETPIICGTHPDDESPAHQPPLSLKQTENPVQVLPGGTGTRELLTHNRELLAFLTHGPVIPMLLPIKPPFGTPLNKSLIGSRHSS